MHEASLWPVNCFVTLTYSDEHLPPDGSLHHRDFQLFIKRLRKRLNLPPSRPLSLGGTGDSPVKTLRYYMCGEYGDLLSRPHYHACLFNINFPDQKTYKFNADTQTYSYTSPSLDALWPLGQCTVGALNLQTAGYTARYCLTRKTGQQADAHYQGRLPEYNHMSTNPGIGHDWFLKFAGTDMLPGDYIVTTRGDKTGVPPYYDKLTRRYGHDLDQVKANRQLRALPHRADNVPARLLVKEQVKQAAIRTLHRNL